MNLALRYRLIDLARGIDSVGLLSKLRDWQYETPEELSARTLATRDDYFDELRRSIPMFKDVAKFEDLPVTDKRFIKDHINELKNPHYKGVVIQKKTGGSTGEPLVFYTGAMSQSYLWAGIFLSWEAAGYQLGEKVAFLAGPSVYKSGYKQSIYYSLLNVTTFSAFDMTPESMTRYGKTLQQEKIRLMYGFPSAIHLMARFYLDAGKVLNTDLRAIVCTAETLTPAMRKDIEAAFGVPCYNQYGSNDAGVSAFECEHRNGLHSISTRNYSEVMPDGKYICTDLHNRAMFLPRHNTGDIVRMSDRRCPCGRGFPIIEEVLGRQNDMVIDSRGVTVHFLFFIILFRVDMRIYAFQVVFDDHHLNVNLHIKEMSDDERVALEKHFLAMIAKTLVFPKVSITFNAPFRTQPNGKHKFVLRDSV